MKLPQTNVVFCPTKRPLPVCTFICWASCVIMSATMPSVGHAQSAWRLAQGTAGNQVNAIDIYAGDPDTMYALGQWFMRSTDNGESWDTVSGPLFGAGTVSAVRVDPADSRIIYAAHQGFDGYETNVSITTDGGNNWRIVLVGSARWCAVIELDPFGHQTVYAGWAPGDLVRTMDYFATWDTLPRVRVLALSSLAIAPSNDSVLVMTHVDGVFKSADRGTSWTELYLGRPFYAWSDVTIHPRDASVVYVAVAASGGVPGGLYLSSDGGATWSSISDGLAGNDVFGTIIQNQKNPNEMYIGCYADSGRVVLRSTNGGTAWIDFSAGLPTSGVVTAMVIDTSSEKVFACVSGGPAPGVYIWDGSTSISQPAAEPEGANELEDPFPNPFRVSTKIRFQLKRSGLVTLTVYDVLGNSVGAIVSGELNTGSHEYVWRPEGLSSGTYFFRLEAEGSSQIRRVILIK